jgi:hypothetical protein
VTLPIAARNNAASSLLAIVELLSSCYWFQKKTVVHCVD